MNPADYYLDLVTPGGPFCESADEEASADTDEQRAAKKKAKEEFRQALVSHFVRQYEKDLLPGVMEVMRLECCLAVQM